MSANQACFPVATMARVLGVSKAGYYAWVHRPPSAHSVARVALRKHELAPSLILLHRSPDAPSWVLADMACDARAFRSDVRAMGAIPVVPSRRGTKQPEPCPDYTDRHRNLIEVSGVAATSGGL